MQFLITFIEGITSFISPCVLPLLPVYIAYFGGKAGNGKPFLRSVFFVLGFATVYSLMGAMAGALGSFFTEYRFLLNLFCGVFTIFLGLSFLGVFHIPVVLKFGGQVKKVTGFLSAYIFGVIFAVNSSACTGAFLGSALLMAADRSSVSVGILLLLVYSMGMGLPYIICSVLLDRLTRQTDFIRSHYRVITAVCGVFLIITGVLMASGFLSGAISSLS